MPINAGNLGGALTKALTPATPSPAAAPVVATAAPVQPKPVAAPTGLKAGYVGIRDQLVKNGIDQSQIGFNSATGYVTVNGQPIVKADQVINGVSYADPTNLQGGIGTYKTQQTATGDEKAYRDALATGQTNPYDQQVSDALAQYLQLIQNPTPYNVYSDPQYAAYEAQQQRAADKGIRVAQESMGQSGFGRSTNLGERAQSIQNDANEYLQTQVIPALMTAHTAEEQAKLQNLAGYLQQLSGQQSLTDTRNQSKLQNLGSLLDYSTGRADTAYDRNYQTGRDKVQDTQWSAEKEISEAALTGVYKGKKTTPEQQRIFQNAWTEAQQLGKVTPALAALDPTLKVGQLLESTRQFNESQDLQRDQMAQSASIAAADRAAANARSAASISASASESAKDRALREREITLEEKKLQQSIDDAKEVGIDDYDLAANDDIATQSGVVYGTSTDDQIRKYVAGQKAKYGWSTDEASKVETYMKAKNADAKKKSDAAKQTKDAKKKKDDKVYQNILSGKPGNFVADT